jgi:hypothetical protein
MSRLFKLDAEHNPVLVGDDLNGIHDWALWHNDEKNIRVGKTRLGDDDISVSTVFLGHTMSDSNAPYLFETFVFGGPLDGEMWRYRTWAEAEAGHAAAVTLCKTAQEQGK